MLLSKTVISFPGLGIGEFSIDNVAFTIGETFSVYWYGVIITLGIVFACMYVMFRAKYEGVLLDDVIDIAIWTVLSGVIGARLYYVLTSLEDYISDPFDFGIFIKNVFNLRNGGLAIYGGIICGALAIIVVTLIKKINSLKLVDMAAPGVMIGQLMGRWGNFFNGEAFGGIVSEGNPLHFMRMGIISNNSIRDFGTSDMVYVHPTFLYESLWNLIGFIIINALYTKKKFNGQIACMYLSWYGFGRMFIEGLRTDSLYVGSFRISQLVGFACFVIFGGLLIAGLIRSRRYSNADAKLTVFDEYMVPDIKIPVFFKKKDDTTVQADSDTADDNAEIQDGEDAPKVDGEDEKNG